MNYSMACQGESGDAVVAYIYPNAGVLSEGESVCISCQAIGAPDVPDGPLGTPSCITLTLRPFTAEDPIPVVSDPIWIGDTPPLQPVPEPSGVLMVFAGVLFLAILPRPKRRRTWATR